MIERSSTIQRVVRVTERRIVDGAEHSFTRCPVALALLDAGRRPFVTAMSASLEIQGIDRYFAVSNSLRHWIADFDAGKYVEPIDVAIDIEGGKLWIA